MEKIDVKSPVAGVVRVTGFQSQPPFSCVDAVNMWPYDPYTNRYVLATRPHLAEWDSPGTGGTLGVNMLSRVNGTSSEDPQRTLLAALDGDLYWWDGDGFSAVANMSGLTVTTDRPVFATPYLAKVVLAVNTTAPLVFDYPTDTLSTLTATAGTVPLDCRVCATWQGCVWLAGAPDSPHIIYASRTGTITDWDTSAVAADTAGAFAMTGDNEGLIGEPVTALMPHTSDSMLVGCQDSLYAFRGHPRRGGIFEQVSKTVGVIGQGAWTRGSDGTLYFLGLDGLYSVAPKAGSTPSRLSDKIPIELRGLDYDMFNPVANLEYDARFEGLHITFRGSQQRAWWYDLSTGSFWPMSFQYYPTVVERFPPIEDGRSTGVVYGGPGYGGMARFDLDSTGEEGWLYGAKIGPIKISPSVTQKGSIDRALLVAESPTEDEDIQIDFYTGATGEDTYARSQQQIPSLRYSTTWNVMAANGGTCFPRISGHAFILEIIGGESTTGRFVFDTLELFVSPKGQSNTNSRLNVSEVTQGGGLTGITLLCLAAMHGTGTKLTTTGWTGYAENDVVVRQAGFNNDCTYLIDLSRMPAAWWAAVNQTDGRDIRVTDGRNYRFAIDLISFNASADTGLVAVRVPSCFSSLTFRVWAGNGSAEAETVSATYGQYNAYENLIGFWPTGGGSDRGSNQLTLTATDLVGASLPTFGAASGPGAFVAGTAYAGESDASGTSTVSQCGHVTTSFAFNDFTILGYQDRGTLTAQSDSATGGVFTFAVGQILNTLGAIIRLRTLGTTEDDSATVDIESVGSADTSAFITSRSSGYEHYAYVGSLTTDPETTALYREGSVVDTFSSPAAVPTLTSTGIRLGITTATDDLASAVQNLSLVFIYSAALSAPIISRMAQMDDQAALYGTWGWSAI